MNEQSSSIAPEGEAAMLVPVLRQMAPVFLGIQAGVALGTLATGVMGSYDLPLPLAEEGHVAVVLPAVDAFADSYGLDRRETRVWVAVHETAHRIEFEALSGVSAHFFALFHNYVAALDVDLSGAFERLQSLDITSPDRLRDAMEEQGFFGLLDSPATQQALTRVQRFLALLEAFADRAVEAAAVRLATGSRIAEAMARRRADQSPGEKMFQKFIGLEILPEHVREADAFCRGVLVAASWPALLAVWDDPDNLPTEEELAEPAAWLARVGG